MGAEQHVASMGDLRTREKFKQRQAKMKRAKRMETGIHYLGQGLGMAIKTASPSKESKLMLGAVSMSLSAGGSMMRDSRRSDEHRAALNAQQPAG